MELWIAVGSAAAAIVSALIAWQQKKIANAAKEIAIKQTAFAEEARDIAKSQTTIAEEARDIAKKQTAIAEESKELALISAKASQESAETAKKTVEEAYRPLLVLHTKYMGWVQDWGFPEEEISSLNCYQLYVTNIGNRNCKDIEITINPALQIIEKVSDEGKNEIKSKESKMIFSEESLYVNQSLSVIKNGLLIAIKDGSSELTITITYKDITTNKDYTESQHQTSLIKLLAK